MYRCSSTKYIGPFLRLHFRVPRRSRSRTSVVPERGVIFDDAAPAVCHSGSTAHCGSALSRPAPAAEQRLGEQRENVCPTGRILHACLQDLCAGTPTRILVLRPVWKACHLQLMTMCVVCAEWAAVRTPERCATQRERDHRIRSKQPGEPGRRFRLSAGTCVVLLSVFWRGGADEAAFVGLSLSRAV